MVVARTTITATEVTIMPLITTDHTAEQPEDTPLTTPTPAPTRVSPMLMVLQAAAPAYGRHTIPIPIPMQPVLLLRRLMAHPVAFMPNKATILPGAAMNPARVEQ